MLNLDDYKISDSISEINFMPKVSGLDWPLSPEQLPPLIIKPKQMTLNSNYSTHKYNSKIGGALSSPHTLSYEKNRMNKLVRQIENFHFERSPPFIWMQNNFGKTITQKEFNRIYRELKEILPPEKAPNRDINRNQKLRFKWMNDIWDDTFSRNVLQQLITRTMVYAE